MLKRSVGAKVGESVGLHGVGASGDLVVLPVRLRPHNRTGVPDTLKKRKCA